MPANNQYFFFSRAAWLPGFAKRSKMLWLVSFIGTLTFASAFIGSVRTAARRSPVLHQLAAAKTLSQTPMIPPIEEREDFIPSFADMTTLNELQKAFTKVSVVYGAAFEFSLSPDAEDTFCKRIAPNLADTSRFFRGDGNQCFLAYEVVKEFIRAGHGYAEITGADDRAELQFVKDGRIAEDYFEQMSYSSSNDDGDDGDDGETKPRWYEHKENPDEEEEQEAEDPRKDPIEFVVFQGPDEDAKIRAIIQVKKDLAAPSTTDEPPPSAYVQLSAELLAAVHCNYQNDPDFTGFVCGALTTGYKWQFCRARIDPDKMDEDGEVGGYIVEFDLTVYDLFGTGSIAASGRTVASRRGASQIFHGLFPDIKAI